MNILVTGGAGFLGSHICERLLLQKNRVICIDNFNDYYDPAIKEENISGFKESSDFLLHRSDILDRDKLDGVFSENQVDIIIHLAARAGVRPSIENAGLYEKVNVEGTINLLDCARKFDVKRFIFASSSSVYGGNKKIPFSETDNVDNPVSPYAATKKAGELICYTYSHLFNISIFCYRFFTVFGPRQRPEMAIHKFIREILSETPLVMYGDGSSSRDYTYIDDVTDVVTSNLDNVNGYEVFNLGNSRPVMLMELVRIIEEVTGKTARIEHKEMQPGDVPATFADIIKARKMLKYNPKTSLEEGVKKFVLWYKEMKEIGKI